jgi:hypothetical protein
MRRRPVVAVAALIAAFALAGLPGPVGSSQPSATTLDLQPAAFTSVMIQADAPALEARGVSEAAPVADVALDAPYVITGAAPAAPATRPSVDQPETGKASAWKEPKRTIKGFASFYDNGTTAMRLPRGTVVRICGKGGCIERRVTDYGPVARNGRIVDLDRSDFFRVCGCPSWSGTTKVTVSIY